MNKVCLINAFGRNIYLGLNNENTFEIKNCKTPLPGEISDFSACIYGDKFHVISLTKLGRLILSTTTDGNIYRRINLVNMQDSNASIKNPKVYYSDGVNIIYTLIEDSKQSLIHYYYMDNNWIGETIKSGADEIVDCKSLDKETLAIMSKNTNLVLESYNTRTKRLSLLTIISRDIKSYDLCMYKDSIHLGWLDTNTLYLDGMPLKNAKDMEGVYFDKSLSVLNAIIQAKDGLTTYKYDRNGWTLKENFYGNRMIFKNYKVCELGCEPIFETNVISSNKSKSLGNNTLLKTLKEQATAIKNLQNINQRQNAELLQLKNSVTSLSKRINKLKDR